MPKTANDGPCVIAAATDGKAAGDIGPDDRLERELEGAERARAGKPSLDDLLAQEKPKPEWPS